MSDQFRVNVEREIWSDNISIRLATKTGDGLAIAKPVVFEQVELGAYIDPCLRLSFDTAQKLMDELWHAGVRPAQTIGTAGQTDAIKYHLEDMRRLVFKDKE